MAGCTSPRVPKAINVIRIRESIPLRHSICQTLTLTPGPSPFGRGAQSAISSRTIYRPYYSVMETKSGALVLADISGYTRFTRMHLTSLLHAEEIISELLEAVIQAAEFPLQVSQLEGDAVLLFAEVGPGREAEAA